MNWLFVLMAAVIGTAALIVVEIYRENRSFVVRTYDIKSQKLKLEKDHTIAFISDLHNHTYGKNNEQLLEAIEAQQPEFILVGGDIPVAKAGHQLNIAVDFIKKLAEKYKIYYSNGNHEHRMRLYPEKYGTMYEEYTKAVEEAGVEYLINECKRITLEDNDLEIAGLEIEQVFYQRFFHEILQKEDVERLIGKKDEKAYTILLAHNPEYFKAYASWGADLTLSGHVHGGVTRLPFLGGVISPSFKLFPKYDGGRKKEYGKELIISRGLGVHTIPIRFLNPAELVILKFTAS
ncbi:MAG: metallophosphoesterase [Lachnospiraceae bacterium]|nr:metallophosphoesterase [Lachnospiraceae bacterium]